MLTNKESVAIALAPGAGTEMCAKHTHDMRWFFSAGLGTNFILYKIAVRINLLPKGANSKLKIPNDF